MLLLMGLSSIVCRPILAIRNPHGFGFDNGAIGPFFSLNDELDSVDVLAGPLALLKVGTGAKRFTVKVDYVGTTTGLRRDVVAYAIFLYLCQCRYRQPTLPSAGISIICVVWTKGCSLRTRNLLGVHAVNPLSVATCSIYTKGLTCQYLQYILAVNSHRGVWWEILLRKSRVRSRLLRTGVVVGMSG